MQFKNYFLYFAFFLSLGFLVSCDDDSDEDAEPSKTEMLTTGKWKGDKILLNGINAASIPGIGANASSFQTLVLEFKNDNTYLATFTVEGQTETTSGNWQFNSAQTTLTLDMFGELNVKNLTDQNLDVTTTLSTESIEFIASLFDIDATLIKLITGGGAVNAEMRFVKQ
ncbi:DUF5004 domain-containing protein [Pontibacter oryzae]|uniref:Lipocalin-like domain-containing protein n=1 Tax=Pontibacter oryzae TaxID=2304593 RepID=A0A399SG17_9BACT|nr:DUF5004 domain-containing protein [Pontibacter oryzae]RIJ41954.1 hypothetical protein D1627_08095 [Pontibacter oryzae]